MIQHTGIIGLGDGDEGKGKDVHFISLILESLLAEGENVLVRRYQGGPNAGHTVEYNNKKIALHQIPSGIINPKAVCLSGSGVYLNPIKYIAEITDLLKAGVYVGPENLKISSKAHLILPHYLDEDFGSFNLKEHSSTGNGIKQCAVAKAGRVGIRIVEALDKDTLEEALRTNLKINLQNKTFSEKQFSDALNLIHSSVRYLKDHIVLEESVISDKRFKFWLSEGAQGAMLDIDSGQYPGITSSSTINPPYRPDLLIGVFKLYQSSVGIQNRPFIAEMKDLSEEDQNKIRIKWAEFGTTTKKPRHIGWFDTVKAEYAVQTTRVDEIVGNCLDRLEDLGKMDLPLRIAVAYKIDGKVYDHWDMEFDSRDKLRRAEPVYQNFKPWRKTVNNKGELNDNAKKYINFIEEKLQKEFCMLGIGSKTNQMYQQKDIKTLISH